LFEEGDPRKPLVMGLLQQRQKEAQPSLPGDAPITPRMPIVGEVDGDRLVLTAEREIVLRCGKASITLTMAGKVIIAGEYVLSRATGMNRIKGAAVQIN
jgi:hypothetical protein